MKQEDSNYSKTDSKKNGYATMVTYEQEKSEKMNLNSEWIACHELFLQWV